MSSIIDRGSKTFIRNLHEIPNAKLVRLSCKREHINARMTKLLTSPPTSALFMVASSALQSTVVSCNKHVHINWFGQSDTLVITETEPSTEFVIITSNTTIEFVAYDVPLTVEPNNSSKSTKLNNGHLQINMETTLDHLRQHIRGLDSQLRTLISAWNQRDSTNGIDGILLRGAPGTGKTLVVDTFGQHICSNGNSDISYITIQVSNLFKKDYGEGERMLINTIDRAIESSSSVLIALDEIDLLGSSGSNNVATRPGEQDSGIDPTTKKMLRLVCALLDDLRRKKKSILFIGVTNNYEGIMPYVLDELTSSGRLSTVIECTIPNVKQRSDILEILTSKLILSDNNVLHDLAKRTPGMVGSDLTDLCREAAMSALTRNQDELQDQRLYVNSVDWSKALAVVRPSGLRSTIHSTTLPESTPTLKKLSTTAVDPVQRVISTTIPALSSPERWISKGVAPPSGLLLYGPSGNGKTLLASSLAKEIQNRGLGNVMIVRCTDIVRSILGASERALTDVFARARRMKPCIVILDQIEAIGKVRGNDDTNERTWDRLLSCLLIELDGMRQSGTLLSSFSSSSSSSSTTTTTSSSDLLGGSHGVYVIGTTRDLSLLDPALVRPGRFDDCVYVGPPTSDERRILLIHGMEKAAPDKSEILSSKVLDEIVSKTNEWSRADVNGLCREAIMEAIRENDETPYLKPKHILNLLSATSKK
jgi:transitional endoplasmic reticulum ATPase